jgi:hypothetical protein
MKNLACHFSQILTELIKTLAALAPRGNNYPPFTVFLWRRLSRLERRFQALYLRWKNGTLPTPRAPRPGRSRKPQPPEPFRLPGSRAWLVGRHGYRIAAYACQFRHLLTTPELAEFLAAAPQARRILSPLCRMLGATLPSNPAPSPTLPEPPKPEPAKPEPAKPEPAPAPPQPRPAPARPAPVQPGPPSPGPMPPGFFSSA